MTPTCVSTPIALLMLCVGLSGCALRYEVVPSDYPKIAQAHAGGGEQQVRVFRPAIEDSPKLDLRNLGRRYISVSGPSGKERTSNLWTFDVDASRTVHILDRDGKAYELSTFRTGPEGLEGVGVPEDVDVRRLRVSIPWTSVKAVELERIHGGRTSGLILGVLGASLFFLSVATSSAPR